MSKTVVSKVELTPATSLISSSSRKRPRLLLVLLAFASIYLIWGSTYLAISYAIKTLPPFLMAATRFLVAGVILFAWSLLRGNPLPTAVQWGQAVIVGALLLLCGNGGVTWAEKYLPSGFTALF